MNHSWFKFRVENNTRQQTSTIRRSNAVKIHHISADLLDVHQTCRKASHYKNTSSSNVDVYTAQRWNAARISTSSSCHSVSSTVEPWRSLTSSKSCCWFIFHTVSPKGTERCWHFKCWACRSEEEEEEEEVDEEVEGLPWQQWRWPQVSEPLMVLIGLSELQSREGCREPVAKSAAARLAHDICNKGGSERRAWASSELLTGINRTQLKLEAGLRPQVVCTA